MVFIYKLFIFYQEGTFILRIFEDLRHQKASWKCTVTNCPWPNASPKKHCKRELQTKHFLHSYGCELDVCVCGGKGVSLCRIITRDKGGIFWRVASQKTQQLEVWGLLCVRVPSTDSSWIFDRSKCGYNVSKHTLSPDSELLSGPMMICLRRETRRVQATTEAPRTVVVWEMITNERHGKEHGWKDQ